MCCSVCWTTVSSKGRRQLFVNTLLSSGRKLSFTVHNSGRSGLPGTLFKVFVLGVCIFQRTVPLCDFLACQDLERPKHLGWGPAALSFWESTVFLALC